jgi:hypothetical protein
VILRIARPRSTDEAGHNFAVNENALKEIGETRKAV